LFIEEIPELHCNKITEIYLPNHKKDLSRLKEISKNINIDVIWFDEEGYQTHAFEVEHSTDITKGLLRLYQIHKLRIKLYIIAEENNKSKFKRELQQNPFYKIKQEYTFKNYQELDEFFESVKKIQKFRKNF